MIGFGENLDPMINFDGTAVQVNLSVAVSRGQHVEKRVNLDIAQPFIRDLVQNRDHRLFELIEKLATYASNEPDEPQLAESFT